MSGSPFVPFYTSDFLAGTSGLTAATKGVYITLICMMYEGEGPLPQSWDTIARRCGCSLPAFKKALDALEDDGKITVSEDGIWSEKCEKHLTRRADRQRSATAAAKKRWEKRQQKQGQADANALRPQCKPEPEPDIKEELSNESSKKGAKAPPKKSASRLPENWTPSEKNIKDAQAKGLTKDEVRHEADKFRDYWISKAGKNAAKLNWDATWRNWIRSSLDYRSQRRPAARQDQRAGNPEHDITAALRKLSDDLRAEENRLDMVPGQHPGDDGTIIDLQASRPGGHGRPGPGRADGAAHGGPAYRLL